MDNERASKIKIHGKEYTLVLTTRATKEIAAKFGGLAKLGDELSNSDSYEKSISDVIWIITCLANQGIAIKNYENGTNDPLLDEETVELLTVPAEISLYKDAILDALVKGTRRDINSGDEKNS